MMRLIVDGRVRRKLCKVVRFDGYDAERHAEIRYLFSNQWIWHLLGEEVTSAKG